MHEEIKKNYLDGVIADSENIVEHKERLVQFLESQMRVSGHVPLLDIEPQYTQQWNGSGYDFGLTVYSVYVGTEKADRLSGVMAGKEIVNYKNLG